MFDIKKLNIWARTKDEKCSDIERILHVASHKEDIMSEKNLDLFIEMMRIVPEFDINDIRRRRGGKMKFPIYINNVLKTMDIDSLDLSVRSNHCLHRAGYRTVADVVESIESSEDLKKIRNCGAKSVDEIMKQLFVYQYTQLTPDRRIRFLKRVVDLNK